tara:strand:+ start:579 stop:980 length:402 start_codon:yes stop_codon:yes gene_type:complete
MIKKFFTIIILTLSWCNISSANIIDLYCEFITGKIEGEGKTEVAEITSYTIGERDKSYSYLANDRQVYLLFAENVLINKYDFKKLSKDILRVEIVEHQSFNPKLYFADEFLFNEWNLEKLNDYISVGLKRCEI